MLPIMSTGAKPTSDNESGSRQAAIASEFDQWAPTYESGRLAGWYQMHAREVFAHLDLSGVRRVLDIGCGTGWALRQLARNNPQIEFIGLDLSPAMIGEAKRLAQAEGLGNLSFIVADWEQVGPLIANGQYPDISPGFDVVLALSSLHYMENLPAALVSIRESLYQGGKLIGVERDTRGSFFTQLWGALHKIVLKDGVEFADTEELVGMMQSAGFSDVRQLASLRHFLRYGKMYTSIAVIEGTVTDGVD